MIKTSRTEEKKPRQLTLAEELTKLDAQDVRLKSMEADGIAFQDFVITELLGGV